MLKHASERLEVRLSDADHPMSAMDDLASLGTIASRQNVFEFFTDALGCMAEGGDPTRLLIGKQHTVLGRMYSLMRISLDQKATLSEKRQQSMTKLREKFGPSEDADACSIGQMIILEGVLHEIDGFYDSSIKRPNAKRKGKWLALPLQEVRAEAVWAGRLRSFKDKHHFREYSQSQKLLYQIPCWEIFAKPCHASESRLQ